MVVVEERDIFCFFTPAPPCSNRVLGNPREDELKGEDPERLCLNFEGREPSVSFGKNVFFFGGNLDFFLYPSRDICAREKSKNIFINIFKRKKKYSKILTF